MHLCHMKHVMLFTENIKPIQGDGGARLEVPGRLNEVVSDFKINKINGTWSRIWR